MRQRWTESDMNDGTNSSRGGCNRLRQGRNASGCRKGGGRCFEPFSFFLFVFSKSEYPSTSGLSLSLGSIHLFFFERFYNPAVGQGAGNEAYLSMPQLV